MRKVAATLGLVVVVSIFIALGRWQWDVAHSNPAGEPLTGTRAFTDVVEPEQYVPLNALGATVTATGTLRTDLARKVPRDDQGQPSQDQCWAVMPLLQSNGLAITVVTGVIPCSQHTNNEQSQQVANFSFSGILQPPDEIPAQPQETGDGYISAANTELLVQQWPFQLYDGYILATGITPVVAGPPGSRLDLQNAAYAIQWWLFCGFAVFVWWRIIRPQAEPAELAHDQH